MLIIRTTLHRNRRKRQDVKQLRRKANHAQIQLSQMGTAVCLDTESLPDHNKKIWQQQPKTRHLGNTSLINPKAVPLRSRHRKQPKARRLGKTSLISPKAIPFWNRHRKIQQQRSNTRHLSKKSLINPKAVPYRNIHSKILQQRPKAYQLGHKSHSHSILLINA